MNDQDTLQENADENTLFKCELCSKKYSLKLSYLEHVISEHTKNEMESEDDSIVCGEGFVSDCYEVSDVTNLYQPEECTTEECSMIVEEQAGSETNSFACVLCRLKFPSDTELASHVTEVHQIRESDSDDGEYDKTTEHTTVDKQSSRILCTNCDKTFTTKSNLRKHMINVHKAKMKASKVFEKVCPLCSFSSNSSSKVAMHRHFEETHEIPLKWERHLFKTSEEFDIWKTEVEANTVSSYIKHSTIKNSAITYHCHRSGSYKRHSKEIKRPKVLGSCKINAFCPSEMKVYVKCSGIEVYYQPTHVGHSNELNHLQLSVKDKKAVIAKLEESQACSDDVLSSFNKAVSEDGELKRINLLRKHDIHNITTRCGIKKEVVKKSPAPVSVQSFVKSVAHSDEIKLIVCKAVGVYSDIYPHLQEDDFLLIYMSKNQYRIFMKHGQGTVCVDYTTGKNFHLYTVSVINENEEGIPVAFMFTNKVEGSTLKTFFEEVKRVCGTILCKVFMSDMGEMCYSAWTSIMGSPKERIFCTWHVLETWRKHLNSKVENKEKREIMFNSLQTLICEVDVDVFLKMLNMILIEDNELSSFVEFFTKEFVISRPYKLWAHSYGKNADLNNNMSLENFNRAVRFSYMKGGKRQQSVEEAVIAALKQIMDKEFFMIFDMRLETLKQKRNSVRCRHKKSLSMDIANVKQVGDMWKVFYSKKDEYYIVMRRGTCADCRLKCFHCKTCCHEYMCSCVAYSIEKDMCEHIHLVVQSSSVTGDQSVVDTVEITEGQQITEYVMDVDGNYQNGTGVYYEEGEENVCQIEIIVDGETNPNDGNGGFDQSNVGTYTLVENQEGVNSYSLDGTQFEGGEVLYMNESESAEFSLQEHKSELLTQFGEFLDTKITEMKQFDVVKRGLMRIINRKWAATKRRPVKVSKRR